MITATLERPDARIAYDVRGPLPAADGMPLLLLIGQPMTGEEFATFAELLEDRTVVTYDPRGLGRSSRTDDTRAQTPEQQADDLHALVAELDAGPVEVFASSGGAVTALAWVARHPDDARTLVAHEPPLLALLPDADTALAIAQQNVEAYDAQGFGHGMARFLAFVMHRGEFDAAYLAGDPPDPGAFGLPAEDDGDRSSPLLSDDASAITRYVPDAAALAAAPTRVVVAAGIDSQDTVTWRTAVATAELLGLPLTEFPSHHAGFLGPESGQEGKPEAFAARLRGADGG